MSFTEEVAKVKVALLEQENKKIRTEFDNHKFQWESSRRELLRDKSCMQSEIRTLRDELDETRKRLHEKAVECEDLSRNMRDEINFQSIPKYQNGCENPSHTQLNIQLKAAESRNCFLENEIKSLLDRNERLTNDMDDVTEGHHQKVLRLTANMQRLELGIVQERQVFVTKYNALKSVIEKHQDYISVIEEQIKTKEQEKNEVLVRAQLQIQNLMDDSIKAIEKMEAEKKDSDQKKVNHELQKEIIVRGSNKSRDRVQVQVTVPSRRHKCHKSHKRFGPKPTPESSSKPKPTTSNLLTYLEHTHQHFENILRTIK